LKRKEKRECGNGDASKGKRVLELGGAMLIGL